MEPAESIQSHLSNFSNSILLYARKEYLTKEDKTLNLRIEKFVTFEMRESVLNG